MTAVDRFRAIRIEVLLGTGSLTIADGLCGVQNAGIRLGPTAAADVTPFRLWYWEVPPSAVDRDCHLGFLSMRWTA